MDNSGPTCVLKVKGLCCDGCARKVKKELKKINGVTRIKADVGRELVKISGREDASILIKAVQKALKKKKAYLKVDIISPSSSNHVVDVHAKQESSSDDNIEVDDDAQHSEDDHESNANKSVVDVHTQDLEGDHGANAQRSEGHRGKGSWFGFNPFRKSRRAH